MSWQDDTFYNSYKNGDTPQESLDKAFDEDHWMVPKGCTFVWVDFATKNSNTRAGSFKIIRRENLEKFNYTVGRSGHYPYKPTIAIDHTLENWPKNETNKIKL